MFGGDKERKVLKAGKGIGSENKDTDDRTFIHEPCQNWKQWRNILNAMKKKVVKLELHTQ